MTFFPLNWPIVSPSSCRTRFSFRTTLSLLANVNGPSSLIQNGRTEVLDPKPWNLSPWCALAGCSHWSGVCVLSRFLTHCESCPPFVSETELSSYQTIAWQKDLDSISCWRGLEQQVRVTWPAVRLRPGSCLCLEPLQTFSFISFLIPCCHTEHADESALIWSKCSCWDSCVRFLF